MWEAVMKKYLVDFQDEGMPPQRRVLLAYDGQDALDRMFACSPANKRTIIFVRKVRAAEQYSTVGLF